MANPTTAAGAEGHADAANTGATTTPAQDAASDSDSPQAKAAATRAANRAADEEAASVKAAEEQAKKDADARNENPNAPVRRGPAENVGGESFDYGHKDEDTLNL